MAFLLRVVYSLKIGTFPSKWLALPDDFCAQGSLIGSHIFIVNLSAPADNSFPLASVDLPSSRVRSPTARWSTKPKLQEGPAVLEGRTDPPPFGSS